MRMVNPRRSLVAAVAVWLSWLGLAQAQGAEGPFPVRHGLNAPQPFEAVQAFPPGRADGAVLAFANPTRPPAYSPTELRAMGYDFIRLPVNPAVLLANPGAEVQVDLESTTLTLPDGRTARFPIEPFARVCLLNGVDQLGYLLGKDKEISAYEQSHWQVRA